ATRAPSRAHERAAASPSPLDAPVISTTRSCSGPGLVGAIPVLRRRVGGQPVRPESRIFGIAGCADEGLLIGRAGGIHAGEARFGQTFGRAIGEDRREAALVPRIGLEAKIAVPELAAGRHTAIDGAVAARLRLAHVGDQDL